MSTRTNPPLDPVTLPLSGKILIEASAGTGKTWTICTLYARLLIEQQLEVRQIIVVTFTKAATAELKARIRARLQTLEQAVAAALEGVTATAGEDGFIGDYLQTSLISDTLRQQALIRLRLAISAFDEAAIYTIHGFCQRALAEVPFAAGQPLNSEAVELDSHYARRVAVDFFRRRVVGGDWSLSMLFALRGRLLPNHLAGLLRERLAKPHATLQFAADADVSAFASYSLLYEHARDVWYRCRQEILETMTEALIALNGRSYTPKTLAASVSAWDDFFSLAFARIVSDVDKSARTKYLGSEFLRKQCKKNATLPQHEFFGLAQDLLDRTEIAKQAVTSLALSLTRELLETGPAAVRRLKREHRVMEFDDMLFNLYAALTAPASGTVLATALRQRYPAALIDEFQDTDPLQLEIFNCIYPESDANAVLLVGDPKQAIYSFRNADLFAYLHAAKSVAAASWTLTQSQRAVPALIRAINALFAANPSAFCIPGLDYLPLRAGARAQRQPALLESASVLEPMHINWLPGGAAMLNRVDAEILAVNNTAAEVARLLNAANAGELTLGDRPLRSGDIAVIVRKHAQAEAMRSALDRVNVQAVLRTQRSVFECDEAEALGHLLTALTRPTDERALRAALASELFGFNAKDFADDGTTSARMLTASAYMEHYRELWERSGWARVWRQVLLDGDGVKRILSTADGERRLTNYFHLSETIQDAWRRLLTFDAVRRWFLEALRSDAGMTDEWQLRLESDAERVQIVTIHASKGLEYPVVFCPFLWMATSAPKTHHGLHFHDRDGEPVIRFGTCEQEQLRQAYLEGFAEDVRLLYVALTRAVHRVYLTAGLYRTNKDAGDAARRTPLHWLLAGGAGLTSADWLEGLGPNALELDAAWQDWSERYKSVVHFRLMQELQAVPAAPEQSKPVLGNAEVSRRWLRPGWRNWSFTSLNQANVRDSLDTSTPIADHDATVYEISQPESQETVVDTDDFRNFPRGAEAGVLMHKVMELADIADTGTWPMAIERALQLHPLSGAKPAGLARLLSNGLTKVAATDIDGQGLVLGKVPAAARLHEMEFVLNCRDLSSEELFELMHKIDIPIHAAPKVRLDGYLRGAIDCVIIHNERFFLIDWKSNYLGDHDGAYAEAALAQVMADEGYHLQYHLYTLALHRYLTERVPGYRYESHFGGCLYVFVRGLRAHRERSTTANGVFACRPAVATIAAMHGLFGGTAA